MARPRLGYVEKAEKEQVNQEIQRLAKVQKQQIEAEYKLKSLANKAKQKAKSKYFVNRFTKQFSQIAKSIPRQVSQPTIDVRKVIAQQQLQQRPQRPKRRNFFEHGSELEVYGDEGLTFFDSEKRSNGESTGSLFGISDD